MGHEAAGVVDELGEGVADVAVGDRVFGFSAGGAAAGEEGRAPTRRREAGRTPDEHKRAMGGGD